jgi:hypothetical protein
MATEIRRGPRSLRRRKVGGERIELSISIYEINGNKYVAGMHWQPLSQSRTPLKEARVEGQKHGWDVVTIKRGPDWIQAGFVSRASGAYKGMYSIASALAGVLGPHWCGIFKTHEEGRYLLIAVDSGGRLVAASDRVLSGEDAKMLASRILSQNEIPYENTYAPPELEFAEKSHTLEDLLPANLSKRVRKDAELTYLTAGLTKDQWRNLLLIGVLAGIGWYGFHLWDQHVEAEKAAATALQQKKADEQLRIANENARRKLEAQALAHPWATMPSADDYISTCEGLIDRMPISPQNWMFIDGTCDKNSLTVDYNRGDGTSSQDLLSAISQFLQAQVTQNGMPPMPPVISFTDSGNKATIVYVLKAPIAGDDPLQSLIDAMTSLLGPLERANAPGLTVFDNITVNQVPVKIVMPPAPAGQPPLPAPEATWRQLHFQFDSQLQPKDVFGALKDHDGLRLTGISTKLSATDATLTWTLTGDFYVQR